MKKLRINLIIFAGRIRNAEKDAHRAADKLTQLLGRQNTLLEVQGRDLKLVGNNAEIIRGLLISGDHERATAVGFKKVSVTEHFDMGVDIIAEKNGERWGIQAKRYSGLVKAAAVRQVVAGLNSYKCNKSMVITNSTFSKYAVKLAQSNHCILIDRMELARLISESK